MTPTKPREEAEGVAAGLTEAQRLAILQGSHLRIEYGTHSGVRGALQRRGIVVDRMYNEDLTDFGREVRTILKGTNE